MPYIKNTAGILPPPTCYASEQERFEAYVAKIVSTILGGLQWETSATAPIDLSAYWLRLDGGGRPVGILKYSVTDGRWIPIHEIPTVAGTSGGAADVYTITNVPALTSSVAKKTYKRFLFVVAKDNTGASTLDVDGTGALPIVRDGGDPLAALNLLEDQIADVIYSPANGGQWELQTPVPPPVATVSTHKTLAAGVPAAGAVADIVHDGTKAPEFVDLSLKCTATDRGYAANDEVSIESFFWTGLGTMIPAFAVSKNATHVTVIRSSTVDTVWVAPKGAGLAYDDDVDTTKWTIVGKCTFLP